MSAPTLFDPSELPEARTPSGSAAASSEPTSLYRKYRPQSFDDRDLVGQEHIVRTLRNAIRLDRVAHAYLFCGPRGTGKTTTARILAKAVNCLDPDPDRRPCNACENCLAIARGATTDIVEIDAASNRGIDDIRDLRERVKYAPSQLKVKFYIVDEAHQITGAAANAFLKTLEEPPAHTRFVLATTDPEELLPTIVSRCQRFDFRRIGTDAMVGRLRDVAALEGIAVSDEALSMVARHATGSLRDGLGLLDQLALHDAAPADADTSVPHREIGAADVRAVLGLSRNDRVTRIVEAVADHDPTAALGVVNQAIEQGEDARQLNRQLVGLLRQLLYHHAGAPTDLDVETAALASRFDLAVLADHARRFGEIDYKIRHAPYGSLPLEIAVVEACLGTAAPLAATAPAVRSLEPAPVPLAPRERADQPPAERELPPTTSLRDRVRGMNPPADGPAARPAPVAPAPAVVSSPPPVRAEPPAELRRPTPIRESAGDGAPSDLGLEQLVDLWPRIRQDVKAVNRRIEALLSEADPAFVVGSTVTVATPYEFHRDKINSDDVRAVVEEVISRLARSAVRVTCVLRDEVDRLRPAAGPVGAPSRSPVTEAALPTDPEPGPAPGVSEDDELLAARRLQAAKNIFDAEEIDET